MTLGVDVDLVLASRSPRRRWLLEGAGFAHVAEHPGFEDSVLEPGAVSGRGWVAALAYLKAWAKSREASAVGRVVVGADTACLKDGRMIGTPRNAGEARAMLAGFCDGEHEVLTGVAVIDMRGGGGRGHEGGAGVRRWMFTDVARVRWGRVGEAALDAYVAGDGWQGKAGGYNLSERMAEGWPITYEGDSGTIMGLPMERLTPLLRSLGVGRVGAGLVLRVEAS